jgi:hypothetical protein
LKQQDWLHLLSIVNPGGLFMQRNTVREEDWNRFFNLLVEGNKEWAKNAAALTVVISKKEVEYKGTVLPAPTHQFDTGAAWERI